jgi:hypothetical protein
MVDKAATSIKVMYSFAFADVPIEDLRDRLYDLMEHFQEISMQGQARPEMVAEIAEEVMVGPLYAGFDNRAITEEVLQMVDMVINQTIDTSINAPDQAADKASSKALLGDVIRAAKDIVNGRNREKAARKSRSGETTDENE